MNPTAQLFCELFRLPAPSFPLLDPTVAATEIEGLRAHGYRIEKDEAGQWGVEGAPDILHPDEIAARTALSSVVWRPQVFRETSSTNDLAGRLALDGAPEGTVIFAESQTAGRGRLGRVWSSASGLGLWFSFILRPRWEVTQLGRVTAQVAVALATGMEELSGLRLAIKWPNDILHAEKKLSGILSESAAQGGSLPHVVVGIGINVRHAREDFPEELQRTATSLALTGGTVPRRAELAASVLNRFARLQSASDDEILLLWKSRCSTLGQAVTLAAGDRLISDVAEDIAADGALLIRLDSGALFEARSGEVTLVKKVL